MREFFQGWPRKIGCLTLVVACLLGELWFRSIYVSDRITIGRYSVVSGSGSFSAGHKGSQLEPLLSSMTINEVRTVMTLGKPRTITSQGFPHFNPRLQYWPCTVWLTILSAYLILWQPRKQKTSAPSTNSIFNSN